MDIQSRKKEHVDTARKGGIEYFAPSGFSEVRFVHQPLPEMGLEAVETACEFFEKKISAPLIISGMTGGYPGAERINLALAAAAEKEGVAFGLGSQRAMLEKPELAKTYKVRKVAPHIPIIGNIGGCQLKKAGLKRVQAMLDDVEANALAIHLNPLQEVCQPEGDTDFGGILGEIEAFCHDLPVPVIVKETGAGISLPAAAVLRKAGARMVDVSGAGGTSFSKAEYARSGKPPVFGEWGNPTVECIASCIKAIEVIGSGGVRSGLDAAKAIALGASFAGAALPFLQSSNPSSEIAAWKRDLKIAMLLTGSANLWQLHRAKLVITGRTAEGMKRLGLDVNLYARR